MRRLEVAIVGSGFAGSILARLLRRQGHHVFLCERAAHPRFALGESSTPLAALCLERLAERYGLTDLSHLAAYGRWLEHVPQLRRGLKRGFTFYSHQPGEPYANGPNNERRLLVAASPADAVADSHWMREDVDAFLVERACSEGVEYIDRLELTGVTCRGGGVRLSGTRMGRSMDLRADLLLDASGAGGFLARHLPIGQHEKGSALRTDLIFGHFSDVGSFPERAVLEGAAFPPGPYPDERAAVHHLLEEGWMYVLPFDHGVVSAGFVLDRNDPAFMQGLDALAPAAAWAHLLARYPTLCDTFADAQPLRPIGRIRELQRRLSRPAGESWALLPHTYCFFSPLFSTGIAWTLLAVERLAHALESPPSRAALRERLVTYGSLLASEADHLARLITGAYRVRHDFELLESYSHLYFAAASFSEAAQRLLPAPAGRGGWTREGFLGATDPIIRHALDRALARLSGLSRVASPQERARFTDEVREAIAPRNVAGLAEPGRNRLYPLDLEALVQNAGLLGLTPGEARENLHRLRGR